ncbi:STAS domain-containing protein [Gluconobacter japonicus]|uniref:STAS domain-containing protein n=1 Tax=Gluconobacter japonicus TaxID=376620 RepID=UPI0024AE5406|nr:STAS domain-containing protein [Gluconobacter japonicus]MDI6651415.1 STAS domain-containing protein [Gluconobacter japonicus]
MKIFYLPEVLDTAAAPGLLKNFKILSEDILLDGREVKRLGGRCLEILLSARKTALSKGKNFKIQNLSHEMEKSLVLMGAKRILDEETT